MSDAPLCYACLRSSRTPSNEPIWEGLCDACRVEMEASVAKQRLRLLGLAGLQKYMAGNCDGHQLLTVEVDENSHGGIYVTTKDGLFELFEERDTKLLRATAVQLLAAAAYIEVSEKARGGGDE